MLLQAFPSGPSGLEMAIIVLFWLLVVLAIIGGLRLVVQKAR